MLQLLMSLFCGYTSSHSSSNCRIRCSFNVTVFLLLLLLILLLLMCCCCFNCCRCYCCGCYCESGINNDAVFGLMCNKEGVDFTNIFTIKFSNKIGLFISLTKYMLFSKRTCLLYSRRKEKRYICC